MGKVHYEITADEAKAAQAFFKLVDAQRKTDDQFKRTVKSGVDFDKMVMKAGQSLKAMALGLVGASGLYAALRLVNAELERRNNLQIKQGQTQTTLADSRRGLIRNLGDVPRAEVQATIRAAQSIAGQTGVAEQHINAAMSNALSASSSNSSNAIADVTQAAKFLADAPEEMSEFAGALGDIRKASKEASAEVNHGLLQAIGAVSRVKNTRQLALNAPQAITGMSAYGATPTEAGAFFSALSNAMADPMGNQSGTASVHFGQRLNKFLRGKGMDGGTLDDQIAVLRSNPALAREFADTASFEAGAMGPLREFILGGDRSTLGRLYGEARQSIPSDPAALADIARKSIGLYGADPLNANAELARRFSGAEGELLTADPKAGRIGVLREGITKILQSTQRSALSEKTSEFLNTVTDGDFLNGRVRGILTSERDRLLNPREYRGGSAGPGGGGYASVPRQSTETETRLAEVLDRLVKALDENTAATDKNSAPKISPSPAAR